MWGVCVRTGRVEWSSGEPYLGGNTHTGITTRHNDYTKICRKTQSTSSTKTKMEQERIFYYSFEYKIMTSLLQAFHALI